MKKLETLYVESTFDCENPTEALSEYTDINVHGDL